ncbi:phosphatidylserine decarboxylase [Bacteriovorax stolpii]|uniref:phosphatidylserine decarboxylase n=1 Tax=Bacteriovorax stolpii TaxID=960 RepID=UPI001C8DBAE5|nr:phosphatidylserine decarboxylase [Bacteriovorax stolpii]
MEIKFYNRVTGKVDHEMVYGDKFIEWLYESPSGKGLSHLVCKAPISKFYGALQDLPLSQQKVAPFIKKFQIQMDDYLPEDGRTEQSPYSTFNQFFIRRFRPGKRPIVENPSEMAAFSEARYYGYESVLDNETVPVKGHNLKPKALIANSKWESTFEDGPLLLARLCPVDYHRYHFPDDGKIVDDYRVSGLYHSVNPLALKSKEDILITNERHVTILETKNFGKLAYIEVGAICVGKIIQSKPLDKGREFVRGEEKGYFLFGGSTVIVVGEKGKWKPSADILANTKKGMETYLHLGMSVADRC